MRSMTGHGQGRAGADGQYFVVELSSVNRKQFELACSLPRGLAALETKVRETVGPAIPRGRLNCSVVREGRNLSSRRSVLDELAAQQYAGELLQLRDALGLGEAITLDLVLKGPGVLGEISAAEDAGAAWPLIEEALQQALTQLVRMREQEGANLADEILRLVDGMEASVEGLRELAPAAIDKFRAALQRRISEAGLVLPVDPDRLAQELVVFADRSDITEELARLGSHLQQLREIVAKTEPVGRTLEFLVQEVNREINTVGAKANDLEITRLVMHVKGELEKVREQIQNVE